MLPVLQIESQRTVLMRRPMLLTLLLAITSATTVANEQQKQQSPPKNVSWLNVELNSEGELLGQVMDKNGSGLANAPLVVQCGKQMTKTVTNQHGQFRLKLATGGMCQMQIDDSTYLCRVWKHGTAPPKSIASIALVPGQSSVVRGNMFRRSGNCPQDCECQECRRHRSGKLAGTAALLGLGGVAAYMALSRDNASD